MTRFNFLCNKTIERQPRVRNLIAILAKTTKKASRLGLGDIIIAKTDQVDYQSVLS